MNFNPRDILRKLSFSFQTSIPAAGAKRRLGVRNSYSGGNSGSFGQSARYSAKSLTSLNTAGVASSTGLNSGGVGGAGGVFQSGSLSSADYIHMHNGLVLSIHMTSPCYSDILPLKIVGKTK